MNKILNLLIAMLFIVSMNSYAQSAIEPFETWTNYNILFTPMEEPNGWSGTDSLIVGYGKPSNPFGTYTSQLIKETPGHTGQFAMKAATKFQDGIALGGLPPKDYPVVVTNSTIILDIANGGISQQGGTPINFRPISTTMYVKNNVVSGDSTFIQAIIIDDGDGADSIIAIADTALGSNISNFTMIELPFVYNGSTLSPTIVRYIISSGNPLAIVDTTNTFVVHDGTEIIIDDIDLTAPLGVRKHIYTSKVCDVYPSLMHDWLQVNYIKKGNEKLALSIVSTNGQVVKKYVLNNAYNQLDVSDLAHGSYVYYIAQVNATIGQGSTQIVQSGKLLK